MMSGLIRTLFGSVAAKLALVLFFMGTTTGIAVVVANLVFAQTVTDLDEMSQQKLPRMTQSSELIIGSNAIKDGIAAILIASSEEELGRLASGVEGQLEVLDYQLASADTDIRDMLTEKIQDLRVDVERLRQARTSEFSSTATVATSIERMETLASRVSARVGEITESAHSSLIRGGKETVDSVDKTFRQIVDVNVAGLSLALQARSEINLLSGMALAHAETTDPSLDTIIRDLSEAAQARLGRQFEQISAIESLTIDLKVLKSTVGLFQEILTLNNFVANTRREEVLVARQKSDAVLSSAIDDLMFDLTINSAEATETNASAISSLLNGEVEGLRSLAVLEATLQHVLAATYSVGAAHDAATLPAAEEKLKTAAASLSNVAVTAPDEISADLSEILGLVSGGNGINALQSQVFLDRENAVAASQAAAKSVLLTANAAAEIGTASGNDIVLSATQLNSKANSAQIWMKWIAAASLAIFTASLALTYSSVIRPILALCRTTERLASGDLGEVAGFDRSAGEIGRMSKALKVFRNNLVEKLDLESEEAARKERAEREKRTTEKNRIAHEVAERERVAKEEHAMAERKAEEAAESERIRQAADEERRNRLKEQEDVVAVLAIGLNKLSDGDLDAVIVDEFPGAYEKLRLDFNDAILTLSKLIAELASEGQAMDMSLSELSSAADSLAKRTEHSAGQLEETAAGVDKLTVAVKSAAEDAVSASSAATNSCERAENGREIIEKAIAAMQKIEASSKGITAVTDLIDDIAHQTNLLALNASVEAARAGEAGRGFAVVASEVRELAGRSAEAAKKIDALLAESQQNVALGSDLVSKTGESLNSISASASETNEMVVRIRNSSQQQAENIAEINSAVTALDQTTQENAAMSEETSSLAASLSGSATNLADAIARFKVPAEFSNHRNTEKSLGADWAGGKATQEEPSTTPAPAPARKVSPSERPTMKVAVGEWSDF